MCSESSVLSHLRLADEARECILNTMLVGRSEELAEDPIYIALLGPSDGFIDSVYAYLSTGKPDLQWFCKVDGLYERVISYCFRLNGDRGKSIFIQENLPGYVESAC